jgi:hypothetical protein
MNGQHLRLLPTEEVALMFGEQWVKAGLISEPAGPFVNVSTKIGHHNHVHRCGFVSVECVLNEILY